VAKVCRGFNWKGTKNYFKFLRFHWFSSFPDTLPRPYSHLLLYLSWSAFRHNVVIYYFNPKMVRECYMEKKKK